MAGMRQVGAAALVAIGTMGLLWPSAPVINVAPPIECVRVISGNRSKYRETAVRELARVGLAEVSVQVEALDSGSHKRGCQNGHVRAHQWAVQRGCRSVLVVEDDVVFTEQVQPAWDGLTAFLESGTRWDAVFLGYTAIRINATAFPRLAVLEKPMLTHAVLFPIETSRRIAGMPPWAPQPAELSITEAYDVHLWYTGVIAQSATYGVYPPMAGQRWSQRTSFSRDKNAALNWGKSLAGMRYLNWLAYGKCTRYFEYAASASAWLGWTGLVEGTDDWAAASRVFSCV